MSLSVAEPENGAAALRRAFDESFARIPEPSPDLVDLVLIGVGGTTNAVRLDQIAGLHTNLPLTRCPGRMPEFLGLSALRGTLIPVYDLGLLLGLAASRGGGLLIARGNPLGFAFDAFEGQLRMPPGVIANAAAGSRQLVRVNHATIPLIDLGALRQRLAGTPQRSAQE